MLAAAVDVVVRPPAVVSVAFHPWVVGNVCV